uniref:Uncharacterized protein n=1 Tax=Rhizophora mucronata TaxID=61149 RepID=A0A2P2QRL9_RHIMU
MNLCPFCWQYLCQCFQVFGASFTFIC